MTPERWQQINQLFHSALECDPSRRAAFLADACAGDADLKEQIESLLQSHEEEETFIEAPPSDIAAELLADRRAGLSVGQGITHYKITAFLGRGGMGEV